MYERNQHTVSEVEDLMSTFPVFPSFSSCFHGNMTGDEEQAIGS